MSSPQDNVWYCNRNYGQRVKTMSNIVTNKSSHFFRPPTQCHKLPQDLQSGSQDNVKYCHNVNTQSHTLCHNWLNVESQHHPTESVSVRPGSRESVGRFLFTKSKQNKTSHCMPRLTRDGSGIHGNVECMHSIHIGFRSASWKWQSEEYPLPSDSWSGTWHWLAGWLRIWEEIFLCVY